MDENPHERTYVEKAGSFAAILEGMTETAGPESERLLQTIQNEHGVTPERILDVGCGIGRHTVEFADHGCHVEGIDISEHFIERAKEMAAEREVTDRTEFHVHDMRDLDAWDGTYDVVTNLWDSFCYYGKETDGEILGDIYDLLDEDGVLAMELGNKECTIRNFDEATVNQVGENLHVQRMEFDLETSHLHSTIDVFAIEDDGYQYEETMELKRRLYSPAELKQLLHEAGFDDVMLIGSGATPGYELTLDSPRLLVLAN